MSAIKKGWIVALAFWIAAGLQHTLGPAVSIGLVGPDFLLVLGMVLAMVHDPRSGAFFGFLAGAIDGALIGADMTALTFTRTISGFFVGFCGFLDFEIRPIYAGVAVAVATVVCNVLFALATPPPQAGAYVRDTIVAALYNGVLAVPLYALVRRPLRRQVK